VTYTIDYAQDESGRWRAKVAGCHFAEPGDADGHPCALNVGTESAPHAAEADALGQILDMVGGDASLELGAVREWQA